MEKNAFERNKIFNDFQISFIFNFKYEIILKIIFRWN